MVVLMVLMVRMVVGMVMVRHLLVRPMMVQLVSSLSLDNVVVSDVIHGRAVAVLRVGPRAGSVVGSHRGGSAGHGVLRLLSWLGLLQVLLLLSGC